MVSYGTKGAWAEYVQRESRTFMGFTLRRNQVFGRDAKSPFILTHLTADASGERGIHATIMMYRLDQRRGWVEVWEKSQTATKAMILFRQRNPYACMVRFDRTAPRNSLAEVKGTKYFQLLK